LDTPHLSPCARVAGATPQTNSREKTAAQEYFVDGSEVLISFIDFLLLQVHETDSL
jgi:hypothetical protein